MAHVKGFEQPSKRYLMVIDAAVCHPKAKFNFTTGQRGFGKAHKEVDSIFKSQNAPSLEDFKEGLSRFVIIFFSIIHIEKRPLLTALKSIDSRVLADIICK